MTASLYFERLLNSFRFFYFICLRMFYLGIPPKKAEMYKQARTSISYGKDGDLWEINVGIIGAQSNKTFKFKLGEEYNSQDLDGSPMKVSIY